jgi:hypothetical protein
VQLPDAVVGLPEEGVELLSVPAAGGGVVEDVAGFRLVPEFLLGQREGLDVRGVRRRQVRDQGVSGVGVGGDAREFDLLAPADNADRGPSSGGDEDALLGGLVAGVAEVLFGRPVDEVQDVFEFGGEAVALGEAVRAELFESFPVDVGFRRGRNVAKPPGEDGMRLTTADVAHGGEQGVQREDGVEHHAHFLPRCSPITGGIGFWVNPPKVSSGSGFRR